MAVFQKFPNSFNTIEEYNAAINKNRNKQSNIRYRNFTQNHFTVGDIEQFEEYRNPGIKIQKTKESKIGETSPTSPKSSLFSNINVNIPKNYWGYSSEDVYNTFKYIFYKFKKGIFVQIKDGKPLILPFSNVNYKNDWNIDYRDIDANIFGGKMSTGIFSSKTSNLFKGKTIPNLFVDKCNSFTDFFNRINQLEFHISKYGVKDLGKVIHNNSRSGISNKKAFSKTASNINKFPEYWYGNNGLIRYEFIVNENDTNIAEICDMLISLCNEREIPDMEFFINKRDFPLLTRNGTEAYKNFYGNNPLKSHAYNTYCPILSFTNVREKKENNEENNKNMYADILIPTPDDWANANKDKVFSKNQFKPIEKTEWEKKIPTAIFRGGSTGIGTIINSNLPKEIITSNIIPDFPITGKVNKRLQLCYISKVLEQTNTLSTSPISISQSSSVPILNAKITKWNLRPRKTYGEKITTIHPSIIEFLGVGNFMDMTEQSKYKYIIHVEGHSSAYRLSKELESGSLILKVESEYSLWFEQFLVPFKHYIPIKEDLSDLIKKINWCISHDSKCEKIAKNSTIFFKKYLSRDSILNYFQKVLHNIKEKSAEYKYEKYQTFLKNIKYVEKYIEENNQKSPSFFDRTKKLNEERYKTILEIKSPDNEQYNITIKKCIELYIKWINMNEETIGDSRINNYIYTKTKRRERATAGFSSSTENNIYKLSYEAFIGISCVNQLITKYNVSSFMYTFGITHSENLLLEKINGITFQDWIGKKIGIITREKNNPQIMENNLNTFFQEYLSIIIDICKTIEKSHVLQFMHNDLYPWNVMIREKKDIPNNQKLIPIIIDYDKSSYEDEKRGYIYWHSDNIPYKFCKFNDIITIVISSLNLILKNRVYLSPKIISIIIDIINFFSGGKYLPKKFITIIDLKIWLKHNAKYSINIINDKSEFNEVGIDTYIKHLEDIKDSIGKNIKDKISSKERNKKGDKNKKEINTISFSYFELYKYLFTDDTPSAILKMYKKKLEKSPGKDIKVLETSFLNYI